MGRHLPLNELFPDDNATIEWLKSQTKTTKSVYKSLWLWFLELTQMNGNQILEDRQHDTEHRWEKKILEFAEWCLTHTCEKHTIETIGVEVEHKKTLSQYGSKGAIGAIRGFFAYHYKDLKFRHSIKKRLAKKPQRLREDYKLSKRDIAMMTNNRG